MTERNGKTEIDKSDISSIDFTKLIAYSTASGGAMGEPGGVNMLMEDGSLYHFNFFESDKRPEDIRPLLDSTFKERGYANLGVGNILFFRAEDTDWLLEKRDRYMEMSDEVFTQWPTTTLYKKWVDFFREHLAEGK